jgi:hypothetical protein
MPNPVAIGGRAPRLSTRSVRSHTPSNVLLRLSTWVRRPGLDAAIARGDRRPGDPALALREAQLVEARRRRRLAARLEDVVAPPSRSPATSSKAPVDRRAVSVASPLLTDVILLLRSPEDVEPRGVALGWRLLTDPGSPLYELEEHGSSKGERLWRESFGVLEALRPA